MVKPGGKNRQRRAKLFYAQAGTLFLLSNSKLQLVLTNGTGKHSRKSSYTQHSFYRRRLGKGQKKTRFFEGTGSFLERIKRARLFLMGYWLYYIKGISIKNSLKIKSG